ncbi:uncharacterized protein LOC131997163 [Stomoxys calcitrans]|uniref:uncharacterized protein LOC131997163 n=1 Tax=Stomoxys calcitrans TaxID=35570 RepID=UPI0027E398DF|nr:uncharacterized protein LOC131997163 [Stomoxys calcitrans]XP_059223628.1 uncharacterized protein LOC131997163 [Stomoxys calcitrans]
MAAYLPRGYWQEEEERPRENNRGARHNERRDGNRQERGHPGADRDLQRGRGRPSIWQYSCGLCQDDHALNSCQRFRDKTPYQRYETVERRGYCRNCLARSHLAPDCTSLTGCRRCHDRHHTLLHGAPQLEEAPLNIDVPVTPPRFLWDIVFVPTAIIRITGEDVDSWASVRVLVSQSSIMSRIAYATFRRLGLRTFLYQGKRFASFKIMSRQPTSTWALKVNALITDELPRQPYSDPLLHDPTRDLTDSSLADPDPRSNVPIDLELGADTYSAIHREGRIFTGLGDVNAYRTVLGYIISGPIRNLNQ